jgi:hypothetical protein
MTPASQPLRDLVGAAIAFTQTALDALPAPIANRLATSGALHVVVGVTPTPRARLVVAAPGGEVALVAARSGPEFPPALGTAAAVVLTAAVAALSPAGRATLAKLQQGGHAPLGLVVTPDASCHLVVDAGDVLPKRLATLQLDLGEPQ